MKAHLICFVLVGTLTFGEGVERALGLLDLLAVRRLGGSLGLGLMARLRLFSLVLERGGDDGEGEVQAQECAKQHLRCGDRSVEFGMRFPATDIRYDTTRCNTIRYDTVQHDT